MFVCSFYECISACINLYMLLRVSSSVSVLVNRLNWLYSTIDDRIMNAEVEVGVGDAWGIYVLK